MVQSYVNGVPPCVVFVPVRVRLVHIHRSTDPQNSHETATGITAAATAAASAATTHSHPRGARRYDLDSDALAVSSRRL